MGHRYGKRYYAIGISALQTEIPESKVSIGANLFTSSNCPIQINKEGRSWLGEINILDFESCNLWFWKETIIENSNFEKKTVEDLDGYMNTFWLSLMLHDVPDYKIAIRFVGDLCDENLSFSKHVKLSNYYGSPNNVFPDLTIEHLKNVVKTTDCLNTLVNEKKWIGRLCRGFYVLKSGLQSYHLEFQYHEIFRALEAILYPDNKDDFVDKGSLVYNLQDLPDSEQKNIFRNMYLLRSNIVHMNKLEDAPFLKNCRDPKKNAAELVCAVRKLATKSYIEIIRNKDLVVVFNQEKDVRNFWRNIVKNTQESPFSIRLTTGDWKISDQ